MKCKARHPPGDEIYRDGAISVFEVDGRKNKVCTRSSTMWCNPTDLEKFRFTVKTFACYQRCSLTTNLYSTMSNLFCFTS